MGIVKDACIFSLVGREMPGQAPGSGEALGGNHPGVSLMEVPFKPYVERGKVSVDLRASIPRTCHGT